MEHQLGERGLLAEAGICGDDLLGHVRIAGWVPEIVPWLKAADVLLFTSRTEGNPNVVLEAMASGCCVVATAVGGCRDTIVTGLNGWLCEPGDALALAACVGQLCARNDLRTQAGLEARRTISAREAPQSVLRCLSEIYGVSELE